MTTRRWFLRGMAAASVVFCGWRFRRSPRYVLLIPRRTYREYSDARIVFDQTAPELPHLFLYPAKLAGALKRGEVFTYDNTTVFSQPGEAHEIRASVSAFFHPQDCDSKKIYAQIVDIMTKREKHSELWVALEKLKRGELDTSGLFIYV